MITLDTSTFIVLLLAAALAGVVLAVLPAWRARRESARTLPVRALLQRRGIAPSRRAALQAELRCELCDAQAECRQLLAEGVDLPAAGCPNGALLQT